MNRKAAGIALILVLSLFAGCDFSPTPNSVTPTPPGSPTAPFTPAAPTGTPQASSATLLWHFQEAASVSAGAVVSDTLVMFGDKDGRFYALDKDSGRLQWKLPVISSIDTTPVIAGRLVYLGAATAPGRESIGELLAIDPRAQDLALRNRTDANFLTSPVVSGRLLVYGDSSGVLHLLDYRRGDEEQVTLGSSGLSGPVADDNAIYVGDEAGTFHAIDLSTQKELWHFQVQIDASLANMAGITGPAITPAAVAGGTVYFANSVGGPVYALDAATGSVKWRFDITNLATPSPTFTPDEDNAAAVTSPPALEGNTLYAGISFGTVGGATPDRTGYLYAIDATTGTQKWSLPVDSEVGARPVVAGGTVYCASRGGIVYAVDAQTGRQLWRFEADAPISASPLVQDGVIYFGTLGGSFYAIK